MGNLDSKLSPYYEIVEEDSNNHGSQTKSYSAKTSGLTNGKFNDDHHQLTNLLNPNNLSIWSIKRANVKNNQNKNAILFEYNSHNSSNLKKSSSQFALNQIRILKKVRHPNIVKYLYSEETSTNPSNPKCLLITESIRPVNILLEALSKEQIARGLFCITNAISFLHDKVSTSHNNLNKNCIYVNNKQIWKLNDFELSISFSNLNKSSLKCIYEEKNKNSITPEEETEFMNNSNNENDLDLILKQFPHCIDSYGWAMMIIDFLTKKSTNEFSATLLNSNSNRIVKTNSTMNMIDDIDDESNEDDYDDENSPSFIELHNFLSKDPKQRPTLQNALNLKIFDLYKSTTNSSSLNSSSSNNSSIFSSNGLDLSNSTENSPFDPFKINSLNDLEANMPKLVDFLASLTKKQAHVLLNEKLIEFLLSPLMFFSEDAKKYILPSIFIPLEEYNSKINNCDPTQLIFYHNCLTNSYLVKNQSTSLKPFIDLDKYKTFILPRIINLFSMRSTSVRLVLLEYFPFYVNLINDTDTLRYEILPELLVGLKETDNNKMVSLTFSCLSFMASILGGEIVVGKSTSNEQKNKYFSDNIPKAIVSYDPIPEKVELNHSSQVKHNNSMASLSDINDLIKKNEQYEINEINDDSSINSKSKKVFSDSMIGLHDAADNTNNGSEELSNAEDNDSWLNDFGWNTNSSERKEINEEKTTEVLQFKKTSIINSNISLSKKTNNDEIGAEFDIKSIKIIRKSETDLIDIFLSDMQPNFNVSKDEKEEKNPKSSKILSNGSVGEGSSSSSISYLSDKLVISDINNTNLKQSNAVANGFSKNNESNLWECEEIIDLE